MQNIFVNKSKLKQTKKKQPENPFADIVKLKMWARFQPKILNSIEVGARKSFRFSSFV